MNHHQIPRGDVLLQRSFLTYQSPDQTINLKSERNRTVFAEIFTTESPFPLSSLCLKILAQKYDSQVTPIILRTVNQSQINTFYDLVDTNLPLEKCISIENEYYWKRAYSSQCTDRMLLNQKTKEVNICWKSLSLTQRYIDLIENTQYEYWIPEEMEKISRLVSPYVTELKVNKLQSMRHTSFEKECDVTSNNSTEDEENTGIDSEKSAPSASENVFFFENCHHVDLSVFGSLVLLHSLTIEFAPPELSSKYHTRFFHFSYIDIQNLARGISELKNLRTFRLRRSRMNNIKFSVLLEALKSTFVEELQFFFCQLEDSCEECLFDYLASTNSLNHFDLTGNYFKHQVIDCLSRAIQTGEFKLSYLDLSRNPISDESLRNLTIALETYTHLRVLKLSGIQVGDIGVSGIVKLVKNNLQLIELHVLAIPMLKGPALIEALKSNHQIQKILYQGCSLTLEDEIKIEILLNRNRHIKSNPYIGDLTKTEEEINDFKRQPKNSIFIKTLENKEKRSHCLQYRFRPSVNEVVSKLSLE